MNFDTNRTATGTGEWAEHKENICKGCPNDCLYCYAAFDADKRWKYRQRQSEWSVEELTKKAERQSYPKRPGVVMFPTTHDITPFNLEAYIRVAKLILAAGNQLLIVSKPRWECMVKLLAELSPWKSQVLLRFTIGTTVNRLAAFWEPGAPLPHERLDCLRYAWKEGWKTSVSIEPMLAGYLGTLNVFVEVDPWVTDTIWIGRMNRPRLRVGADDPEKAAAVEEIERLQSDAEILKLVEVLKYHRKTRWKDSIKRVIEAAEVRN